MKLDKLREIIREEVRAAVKLELQEVMNEAVKVASAPNVVSHSYDKLVEVEKPKPTKTNPVAKKSSLEEMLQQTKQAMTNEEYRTIFNGTSDMVSGMPNMATTMASRMSVAAGNQPGLDISQLDFVKKAGAVFKASEEKDKQKASVI